MKFKWLSASLILAMLISLVAPLSAFAAVTLSVSNLQYRNTSFVPGTDPANPTPSVDQFTTNPITVIANFNGLGDDEIGNIYFEVTNINTGKSFVDKSSKATKTGSNELSFTNVNLTEGLNKIVLKFDGTVSTASAPSWAYYTPVSTINDLSINGETFIDGQMYPKSAPYTGATITGSAGNATSIDAYLNGTAYQPANFTRNQFTYITNTGRVNDMNFKPGDNSITFIAKNDTNTYNLDKSFIYDNGKAFAYNSFIDLKNGTAAPSQKLIQNPIVERPTSGTQNPNVTLSASLKNSMTSGVTDYVYADIYTVGTGGTYTVHYVFADQSFTVVGGGSLNGGDAAYQPASTKTTAASGNYEVHNIQVDLPINTSSRAQQVVVVFTPRVSTEAAQTSTFDFSYVDKSDAYVTSVGRVVSGVATPIAFNESGTTQITEFPSTMRVSTENTAQVLVKLNGVPYNDGSHSDGIYATTGTTGGTVDIVLQGLRDGATTLDVIPYKTTGASAPSSPAGGKSYNLLISAAPYVIVDNIYNGMVVASPTEILCGATAQCVSGRVINLGGGTLKATVNNVDVPITYDATTTNKFTVDLTSYFASDKTDGKKTVRFDISINGQKVTEASYDIFVFSANLPSITNFEPSYDTSDTRFTKDTRPDIYFTTASEVKITGTAANANLVVKYTKPSSTTPIAVSISPTSAGATGATFFSIATGTTPDGKIQLDEFGLYTFTVVGTNDSGATVTKSFTLNREATSYQIIEPKVIKNPDGKDQANINKNFQHIVILAENADSVFIGKEQASKDTRADHKNEYYFDLNDLKAGKNDVKFTVNRGKDKVSGSFILFNVDTPIEGNQYKSLLENKMKVFNGDVELNFPKDTKLMRNDRTDEKQYITTQRRILFGLANTDDGRVDKENEDKRGRNFLTETTGRFKPASKLVWIDAGTIEDINAPNEDEKLKDAMQGSGRLPNDTSFINTSVGQFYNRGIKDIVVPTKRGTLTLKYDANIRDDSWKYLTVYQYNVFADNNGNPVLARSEWRNIGGVVDLKKNTITVPVDSFGYFQVMYMDNSFDDVTNHGWARDYIDTLYSKGMMKNKDTSPSKFLPDESITRGEFVTMLVKIFDIPLENQDTLVGDSTNTHVFNGTFKDVQRGNDLVGSYGLYDFMHIEAAARAGIVRGNADGYFGHKDLLSRQDAAVMIARAADLKMGTDAAKVLASLQKSFTDGSSIDYYARPAVEAATKAGLIEGMPNVLLEGQKKQTVRFAPKDYFSRSEAAAIANRVLKQQKKIP
ncbi:S-layer homology domain-containing protein [Paenibacillus rigui]|nr:S-layer homology domain-containing protein [Paenibacillus rigui]